MDRQEVADFGRLFKQFLEQVVHRAPIPDERSIQARLERHLGRPPEETPVVKRTFLRHDHANVHLAVERWFSAAGRTYEVVGLTGRGRRMDSLSELLDAATRTGDFIVGAVDYANIAVSPDEEIACISFGFYLGAEDGERLVVLVRGPNPEYGMATVDLEVLAPDPETAQRFLAGVERLIDEHNVFRGQVISLEGQAFGHGIDLFRFHRRPELGPSDIVLPEGLLGRIERQVVGVARRREQLLAAGQHLRRGLLLYGPPGTGKTHSVRFLLSQLPGFTVVVLTGPSIQYVGTACKLARQLQPALVVLEDCDLIAEARDRRSGDQPLLFQVLNEMDGLEDEIDVAFLLTTNRADLLEPALAQRPGRVDLAVEIPLPDAEGRRRLFNLYGRRLGLEDGAVTSVVERTAGTTASFTKELVRRAVLFAAERGADRAQAEDVQGALDELMSDRDLLTRRLLGAGDGQG